MIKCVNWILSRKCNLSCNYCKIAKDYKDSPYPPLDYFFKNEMSTSFIIRGLEWFKNHNPNCFHVFLGGEPFFSRQDLPIIINYCNKNNIFYTIITNNCDQIKDKVKRLFSKVDYVAGFTVSVDPIIYNYNGTSHRFQKSVQGFANLLTYMNTYRNMIKDPVAEITIDNNNLDYIIPLVENLTTKGICSDITFIDISKSKYYDFSNITDTSLLVKNSDKLSEIFDHIIKNKLDVHMADKLLPRILNILPSELDCQIENNIHNITIDSDGSVRLCLRIRGTETPKNNLFSYLNSNEKLNKMLTENIKIDKLKYCLGCNWSCQLMTLIDTDNEMNHVERRNI